MLSLRFEACERSNHERESGTSRTEKYSRNGTDFLRICELTTSASFDSQENQKLELSNQRAIAVRSSRLLFLERTALSRFICLQEKKEAVNRMRELEDSFRMREGVSYDSLIQSFCFQAYLSPNS